MANPIKTFLYAIIGKEENDVSEDEIIKAKTAGEMAARNVAKRMGIVEQVEVDAAKAREVAEAKASEKSADGNEVQISK